MLSQLPLKCIELSQMGLDMQKRCVVLKLHYSERKHFNTQKYCEIDLCLQNVTSVESLGLTPAFPLTQDHKQQGRLRSLNFYQDIEVRAISEEVNNGLFEANVFNSKLPFLCVFLAIYNQHDSLSQYSVMRRSNHHCLPTQPDHYITSSQRKRFVFHWNYC